LGPRRWPDDIRLSCLVVLRVWVMTDSLLRLCDLVWVITTQCMNGHNPLYWSHAVGYAGGNRHWLLVGTHAVAGCPHLHDGVAVITNGCSCVP